MTEPQGIKPPPPLGLPASLLYFGIPAALFSTSFLGLLPWMLRHGVSGFVTFNVTFCVPLGLMFVAAVVATAREQGTSRVDVLRRRLRLTPMAPSAWAWTAALCVFELLPLPPIDWVQPWLSQVRLYTPPAEFTDFMQHFDRTPGSFLWIPLVGQWWVLAYYVVVFLLVFNIGGEELWWRGYILPRQERAMGRWAWVANGTLWAAFHIFYHATLFSFVSMLPGTLAIAFVCQRTRSTWPGIIGHTVMNGALPVMLLRGILG